MFEKTDSQGAHIDVPFAEGGFLDMDITKGDVGKDGGEKAFTTTSPEINETWVQQKQDKVYIYEAVKLPENTVRIHYEGEDGKYENFDVWNWGDVASPSEPFHKEKS